MRISELYSSKFLKSGDLVVEGPKKVTIEKVTREKLGDDIVPIIHFTNCKPLVLNRTNGNAIAELLGDDETLNWAGGVVVLFRSTTEFRGQTVGCIRVRGVRSETIEEEVDF